MRPAQDAAIAQTIYVNHVGYDVDGAKRAVVSASGALQGFQLVRTSDGTSVYDGSLTAHPGFSEWGGGPEYYVADFSCLDEPGEYVLYVNGAPSHAFAVGERRMFDATFAQVLGYFHASRADDDEIWAADEHVPFVGSTDTADVRGGWYDASGDVSKYLSHLSYANFMNPQQTPLVAWGLAWVADEGAHLLAPAGLEQAVQQEALWGADYLVRALDGGGYFYMTVFDRWTGDPAARRICAYSTAAGTMSNDWQAGMREGAGMSIAALARISRWGKSGAFSAEAYLAAAETAFAHLMVRNAEYLDNGTENIIDDYTALLAATELFAATGRAEYRAAARARATALLERLHATGYFIADDGARPFWHASDAGLPVIALARYAEVETDPPAREAAIAGIRKHLDYLVQVTHATANPFGYARQHTNIGPGIRTTFFVPHDNETGYWWQGENARLGSLAAAAWIGGRVAYPPTDSGLGVPPQLDAFAADQLDWILGKNPESASMMWGVGRNNPPPYCPERNLRNGEHEGGIANGITGRHADGTGIQWMSTEPDCWTNWRWSEQWLPHAAWYMIAVTAAAL